MRQDVENIIEIHRVAVPKSILGWAAEDEEMPKISMK